VSFISHEHSGKIVIFGEGVSQWRLDYYPKRKERNTAG
jgi:hypothetical protein